MCMMQEINESPLEPVVENAIENPTAKNASRASSGFVLRAEQVSYWIILVLLFCTPLVIGLTPGLSLELGKHFYLSLLGGIALIAWLVARIKDAKILLPKTPLAWAGIGLFFVTLVAAFASESFRMSFFGAGYETTSVVSLGFFLLMAFLVSSLFRTTHKISGFFSVFYISLLLVFVVHALHLFFPSLIIPTILSGQTANTLGKWTDLGIFFGLGTMLSLFSLEAYRLKGGPSLFMRAIFIVSLVALISINIPLVWLVLGLVALATLLFFIVRPGGKKRRISIPATTLLIISAAFYFGGNPSSTGNQPVLNAFSAVATKLGGSLPGDFDVRPSWPITYQVGTAVLAKRPFFGVGPNRFLAGWYRYRPLEINKEVVSGVQLWNVDFSGGYGTIPSMLVTEGIVGFAAWILFLLTLLFVGIMALRAKNVDSHKYVLVFFSWTTAVYFWIFQVFYLPGTALTMLTFLSTGLFVGALATAGLLKDREFSVVGSNRFSFMGPLASIVLILFVLGWGFKTVKAYSAASDFVSGVAVAATGDYDTAQRAMARAYESDPQDLYARSRAQVALVRISKIINSTTGDVESRRAEFKAASDDAITASRAAVDLDPSNFNNWLTLGDVYTALVAPGVDGARDLAKDAYEKSLVLFPNNPGAHLSLARLWVAAGDRKKARAELAESLQLKSDFAPSLYLSAQLDADDGNVDSAIASTEQAAKLAPRDVGIMFQLGLLEYTKKDYAKAIPPLEAAVSLAGDYSNARYFLGISYSQVGRNADAIAQFEAIEKLNPDNQETKKILANLHAGRKALQSVTPTPEKIKTPTLK